MQSVWLALVVQNRAESRIDLDGTMERIGLRTDGNRIAFHKDTIALSSACGYKTQTKQNGLLLLGCLHFPTS